MPATIQIPNPELQALFSVELVRFRRLYLMEALQMTVGKLRIAIARTESPSTGRFYNLSELTPRSGSVFSDFNHRIRALIGIV
ncbi:MAG TPA: XcyI family restriction endonuclease [Methylomirabilota bacterium]|nr:XcyI family restriction endonuclease [Methylomirabilota bacterium]